MEGSTIRDVLTLFATEPVRKQQVQEAVPMTVTVGRLGIAIGRRGWSRRGQVGLRQGLPWQFTFIPDRHGIMKARIIRHHR